LAASAAKMTANDRCIRLIAFGELMKYVLMPLAKIPRMKGSALDSPKNNISVVKTPL